MEQGRWDSGPSLKALRVLPSWHSLRAGDSDLNSSSSHLQQGAVVSLEAWARLRLHCDCWTVVSGRRRHGPGHSAFHLKV